MATGPLASSAGLAWTVAWDKGPFLGKDVLLAQRDGGTARRLVGLEMLDKSIPRHGYAIQDQDGRKIGEVTSGTQSPTLGKPIGMGYVASAHAKPGTAIAIAIRDKQIPATIKRAPLIEKK